MRKLIALLLFVFGLQAQTQTPVCWQMNPQTNTTTRIPCPEPATVAVKADTAPAPIPIPQSTAPTFTYPNVWLGAGGAYTSQSTPNVAGWMSVAKMLSQSGPVYSYTTTDYTSARSKPFTLQSSVRTGLGTVVRQWGPVSVIGLADAGTALAAKPVMGVGPSTGTSVGGAFSGGGFAVWRFGKTGQFTVEAGARILKTTIGGSQVVVEFGLGFIPGGQK
jgi:hypothetical protein